MAWLSVVKASQPAFAGSPGARTPGGARIFQRERIRARAGISGIWHWKGHLRAKPFNSERNGKVSPGRLLELVERIN